MLKQDYILRLISQLAGALARLAKRLRGGRREEVEQELESALQEFSGLGFSLLESLSLKALLEVLEAGGETDPARCLAIAELCTLRAQLDEREGDPDRAVQRRVVALTLYLEALLVFRHDSLRDAEARMGELLTLLADFELPEETELRLFRYHAARGRYASAEDVLYDMIERGIGGVELKAEGRAFYKELLQLSDSELDAGQLPRDEVIEGLRSVER